MDFGSYCLGTFLRYLRNDERVFQGFVPRKEVLKKMLIDLRIRSSNKAMQDQACEFASFLLRYHSSIDYADFSDDPTITTILRRYEQIKYSSELELLGKNVETL